MEIGYCWRLNFSACFCNASVSLIVTRVHCKKAKESYIEKIDFGSDAILVPGVCKNSEQEQVLRGVLREIWSECNGSAYNSIASYLEQMGDAMAEQELMLYQHA